MTSRHCLVILAVATLLCAGCVQRDDDAVVVMVAASLTDVYVQIENAYLADHDEATLQVSVGGSDQLARSLLDGATADIFISADARQMETVVEGDLVAAEPETFATNRLEIAVPKGNPLGVEDLGDLEDRDMVVVVGTPEVPVGRYTMLAMEQAGVTLHPASLEPDVRSVLGKVRMGEADAGVVYATDVLAFADEIDGIPIEPAVETTYSIARLTSRPAAVDFYAYLTGPDAATVLEARGFGPP